MQEQGFTKKDWTLFVSKIADWQEAYMDRLNKEYIITKRSYKSVRKILET